MNGAVASGGKIDTAFETALWKLKAMNDRGLHLRRIRTNPRIDQLPRVNKRFDLVEVDARQGDQHEHRAVRLEDIHRRLPCDPGRRTGRPEKLPMHPLRAREHFERFRPHPIAGKISLHRFAFRSAPISTPELRLTIAHFQTESSGGVPWRRSSHCPRSGPALPALEPVVFPICASAR